MDSNTKSSIALSFIGVFFFFLSLYLLQAILMPVVISLFLITLIWPVNKYLNSKMPKQIGDTLSFFILVGLVVIFFGSFYLSISDITAEAPKYKDSIVGAYDDFRSYLRKNGLPVPSKIDADSVNSIATLLISEFYVILGYIAFTAGLLILGIPEMINWRGKLTGLFGEVDGDKILKALNESAVAFQKYLWITTLIGVLSAVLTGGFTWFVGLDFPLTWAFLAFMLNFIPIIGAFLIIIPPTALAYIQFHDDPAMITVIFTGMTFIQFFIGTIIDPKFQGKYLSMSSVIILISVAFWGYLWGVMGAFLAVPITNSIMIKFFHFPSTMWVANIISEEN